MGTSPGKVTDATSANVASSATSVTLFNANGGANFRALFNDSTATLYLKFGATASTSSYTVQVLTNTYYEFPIPLYRGKVDGIWASANGSARTTEY